MTPGQQRALDAYFARYGVPDTDAPIDPATLFGRHAPLILEIGFGMGETTAAMADEDRSRDVLAVDVHTPGVGALLADIGRRGLENVRVMRGDAMPLLRTRLPDGSVAEIRVFFPDPWPKPRHHKRRLVDTEFIDLAAAKLQSGGVLHCATDWTSYAEQMLATVSGDERYTVDGFSPRPASRPVTRFENQGIAKGHQVYDVIAQRR